MIFGSIAFLVFFLVTFSIYWLVPRVRVPVLLLASYIFYGYWDWRFLGLIVLSTIIDYSIGRKIAGTASKANRKALLWASIAANLSILVAFKYFNFFVESLVLAGDQFGLTLGFNELNIILPLGISFFTFQTMSYTIDLYYDRIKVEENYLRFALFVSFFPQLVAGPIVRARDILPQLDNMRERVVPKLGPIFLLFIIGFLKKFCVADQIAVVIDPIFASGGEYGWSIRSASLVLFYAQIYCDFSGYSDMAIALAASLGIAIPRNFNMPFLAHSLSNFWQRWHISLSSWFRDYVYIPLGGNRTSKSKWARNTMLTMTLSGFWHGAAGGFILWGVIHGLALLANKGLERIGNFRGALIKPVGMVVTFVTVSLFWLPFRVPHLSDLKHWVGSELINPSLSIDVIGLVPAFVGMAFIMVVFFTKQQAERIPAPFCSLVIGLLAAISIGLARHTYTPFIYFQF